VSHSEIQESISEREYGNSAMWMQNELWNKAWIADSMKKGNMFDDRGSAIQCVAPSIKRFEIPHKIKEELFGFGFGFILDFRHGARREELFEDSLKPWASRFCRIFQNIEDWKPALYSRISLRRN
jgi:hypothetical protein